MKVDFGRYKNSLLTSRENNPGRSYGGIVFEKVLKKVVHKYHSLRCTLLKDSTFLEEDSLYMCSLFPVQIIDQIIQAFQPRTVLDVGCGTGISLAYFLQRNIDAIGIENSRLAISKSTVSEKIIRHNLKKELNLGRKFDLVWSFEVIEHIHPKFEAFFLGTLTRHSDRIVISAATPGQGGHGHFNEKPAQYWVKRFSDLKLKLNENITECLRRIPEMHSENILVFEKDKLS